MNGLTSSTTDPAAHHLTAGPALLGVGPLECGDHPRFGLSSFCLWRWAKRESKATRIAALQGMARPERDTNCRRPALGRRLGTAVLCGLALGCGTTRMTDTQRTATEQ